MKTTTNANHHLWNNHGTWFVCYTVYPTPLTKERRRESLRTKSLEEARRRRDALFARRRATSPSEDASGCRPRGSGVPAAICLSLSA